MKLRSRLVLSSAFACLVGLSGATIFACDTPPCRHGGPNAGSDSDQNPDPENPGTKLRDPEDKKQSPVPKKCVRVKNPIQRRECINSCEGKKDKDCAPVEKPPREGGRHSSNDGNDGGESVASSAARMSNAYMKSGVSSAFDGDNGAEDSDAAIKSVMDLPQDSSRPRVKHTTGDMPDGGAVR